jgi:hypothetical protein
LLAGVAAQFDQAKDYNSDSSVSGVARKAEFVLKPIIAEQNEAGTGSAKLGFPRFFGQLVGDQFL